MKKEQNLQEPQKQALNIPVVIGCYYTIRYIDPYIRKERECTVRGDNEEHAKERFYQLYKGSFMIGISLDNNR